MPACARLLIVLACAALALPAARARAGAVEVSVVGGTLKVKGSVDGDVLTIDRVTQDTVDVVPGIGTTVNGGGAGQSFAGITKGAKITLGDGNDGVQIVDFLFDVLDIKTGGGEDRVRLEDTVVSGKLKIDLGADNNVLEVCTAALAKVAIKAGAPSRGLVVAECPGLAAEESRGSALVLRDVSIVEALTMKLGAGVDHVAISDFEAHGDVKIALGADSGVARMCDGTVDGKLSLTSGKSISDENRTVECDLSGMVQGEVAIVLHNVGFQGAVNVKTGDGSDGLLLNNIVVVGDAKLDVGAGNNGVSLADSSYRQDLSGRSGKGADVWSVQDLDIDGDVKFTLGAGDNALDDFGTMAPTHIDGDLTVKGGKGNDIIDTTTMTVGGTRKIDGGGGIDTITP